MEDPAHDARVDTIARRAALASLIAKWRARAKETDELGSACHSMQLHADAKMIRDFADELEAVVKERE